MYLVELKVNLNRQQVSVKTRCSSVPCSRRFGYFTTQPLCSGSPLRFQRLTAVGLFKCLFKYDFWNMFLLFTPLLLADQYLQVLANRHARIELALKHYLQSTQRVQACPSCPQDYLVFSWDRRPLSIHNVCPLNTLITNWFSISLAIKWHQLC